MAQNAAQAVGKYFPFSYREGFALFLRIYPIWKILNSVEILFGMPHEFGLVA